MQKKKDLKKEYKRDRERIQKGIKTGILNVVKKLIEKGISLVEAAEFTPYSAQELNKMLKITA